MLLKLPEQKTSDRQVARAFVLGINGRPACAGTIRLGQHRACRARETVVNAMMLPIFVRYAPRRGRISSQRFQAPSLRLLRKAEPHFDDERAAVREQSLEITDALRFLDYLLVGA